MFIITYDVYENGKIIDSGVDNFKHIYQLSPLLEELREETQKRLEGEDCVITIGNIRIIETKGEEDDI